MKTTLATLILGLSTLSLYAAFDSGSDGSDGALAVTSNTTLALPDDGIFNFTTITIDSGVTLRFTRNAANTPVYMLATGDVSIEGNIDVSGSNSVGSAGGQGGPGGYKGGNAAAGPLAAGYGQGPGGGTPGTFDAIDTSTSVGYGNYLGLKERDNSGDGYGNTLLMPLVGGSGSAGCTDEAAGGGGGGGALLISSNSLISFSGTIYSIGGAGRASGGFTDFSYGSGGAVRFVAPEINDFAGFIYVSAATQNQYAAGRVRFDAFKIIGSATVFPPEALSTGANLQVFPPNNPKVRIVRIGDNIVPEAPTSSLYYLLPPGSESFVDVEVEVSDFNYNVPIVLTLTPENGSPSTSTTSVDNTALAGSNPATALFNVPFPVGVQTRVDVWTQ